MTIQTPTRQAPETSTVVEALLGEHGSGHEQRIREGVDRVAQRYLDLKVAIIGMCNWLAAFAKKFGRKGPAFQPRPLWANLVGGGGGGGGGLWFLRRRCAGLGCERSRK